MLPSSSNAGPTWIDGIVESVATTTHRTIQHIPSRSFRQVNSRKRPKLNQYIPPSTSQTRETVHTAFRFAGRRDGNMEVSSGHLTSCPSSLTTPQSSQIAGPEEEMTGFDFSMFDEPSASGEDDTLNQSYKRKRTAGVSGPYYYCCIIPCLLSLSGQSTPCLDQGTWDISLRDHPAGWTRWKC